MKNPYEELFWSTVWELMIRAFAIVGFLSMILIALAML